MDELVSPQEIYDRTLAAGLNVAELCRRAEIHVTTFNRWKRGDNHINVNSYQKLLTVLTEAERSALPSDAAE